MVVEREQAGDGGEEGREDEKGERGRPGQEAQGQGAVHGAVSEARGRYASVWLGYDAGIQACALCSCLCEHRSLQVQDLRSERHSLPLCPHKQTQVAPLQLAN